MINPVMHDIHARKPVDKTAALVTGRGFDYVADCRPNAGDSRNPLATKKDIPKNMPMLVGHKYGRMTVIGVAADRKASWVVRCSCGTYTYRKTRAIRNQANDFDRCGECRHLAFIKKHNLFLATGISKDFL